LVKPGIMLTDEQEKQIREQILKQVESLPEDKRQEIKEYITSLNKEQLEEFLRKNAELQEKGSGQESKSQNKCIYCLLAEKKVESKVIYEDKDYLGALEINPFSKAHTILIPKKHLEKAKDLNQASFKIAKKIGNNLLKKLKEDNIESFELNTSEDLGHAIINIIPVYKGEKLKFERKPAKKEELEELYKKIGLMKKKEKIIKIKTEKSEELKEKKEKSEREKPKESYIRIP